MVESQNGLGWEGPDRHSRSNPPAVSTSHQTSLLKDKTTQELPHTACFLIPAWVCGNLISFMP